ncbi:DUF3052 domain-containing protein [Lysobacter claricitrinus]|uniref:DUF3052 domain-containing protein n=1 Tax=Lysobacter claricitrinus TaxID=3367728 RepID=UPI0037DA7E65
MTPAAPAGYSGKPLWAKLGYAESTVALVVSAPEDYTQMLAGLPAGVAFAKTPSRRVQLVHVFSRSLDELRTWLSDVPPLLAPDAMIWVSWPKKASKVPTDITEDRIRDVALPLGLVDIKVCAVDSVWSGLKLVRRKALRVPAS